MEKTEAILGEILDVGRRLRPLGYLLSHFDAGGEGEINEEALRNLGALLEHEVQILEAIGKSLNEWGEGPA